MRRSTNSLPSLTHCSKTLKYPENQLISTQRQFQHRLTPSLGQSTNDNKSYRPLIHFRDNKTNDTPFVSFASINVENKKQILNKMKQFQLRQSNLAFSMKLQIEFNKRQYKKINDFVQSTRIKQKQSFVRMVKQLQPLKINKNITTTQKYKNKVKKIIGVQLKLQRSLFQNNKGIWKPYVDYDAVTVGFDGKVFFFGGRKYSNVGCFDISNNKWSDDLELKKFKPFGETQGTVYKKYIVFTGGTRYLQGFTIPMNLVQKINMQTLEQTIYQFDQNIVLPRYCHAQCLYGEFILVSGGIDIKDQLFNNFMAYNISKNYWSVLPIFKKPSKLQEGFAKHKMIPIFYKREFYNIFDSAPRSSPNEDHIQQEGVYMFGGEDSNVNLSNKLYIIKLGHPSIVIEEAQTSGKPPEPKKYFAMHRFNSFLFIHGGRNDQMNPFTLKSIHCLNLKNLNWVVTTIDKGFRRYGHIFTQSNPYQLLIMGGIGTQGFSKDVCSFQVQQISQFE